MQAFLARRGSFAAAILTICAIGGHLGSRGRAARTRAPSGGADAAVTRSGPVSDATSTVDATGAGQRRWLLPTRGSPRAPPRSPPPRPRTRRPSPVHAGRRLAARLHGRHQHFPAALHRGPGVDDPSTAPVTPFASVAFSSLAAPYPDVAGCMGYADEGHARRPQLATARPASPSCSSATRWRARKEIMKCEPRPRSALFGNRPLATSGRAHGHRQVGQHERRLFITVQARAVRRRRRNGLPHQLSSIFNRLGRPNG